MAQLSRDMRDRSTKVRCTQEAQNSFEGEHNIDSGDLVTFMGGSERGYGGLALCTAREWKDKVAGQRRASSRAAVVSLKCQHTSASGSKVARRVTVLSVCGPTVPLARRGTSERERLHEDLKQACRKERPSTDLVVVQGDFSSKVGARQASDSQRVGVCGLGTRSESGQHLVEAVDELELEVTSTQLKKRRVQLATWHGGRPARSSRRSFRAGVPGLHSQADFVVVPQRVKRIVASCSAVVPQHVQHRSGHSAVVTAVEVGKVHKVSCGKRYLAAKLDYCRLQEPEVRDRYQRDLEEKLRALRGAGDQGVSAAECWYRSTKKALEEAAEETLPPAPQRVGGSTKYTSGRRLSELSVQQRQLTTKTYGRSRKSREARVKLKKRRSLVLKEVRSRQKELQEKRLAHLAAKLEESSDSHKVWEWVRQTKRRSTVS